MVFPRSQLRGNGRDERQGDAGESSSPLCSTRTPALPSRLGNAVSRSGRPRDPALSTDAAVSAAASRLGNRQGPTTIPICAVGFEVTFEQLVHIVRRQPLVRQWLPQQDVHVPERRDAASGSVEVARISAAAAVVDTVAACMTYLLSERQQHGETLMTTTTPSVDASPRPPARLARAERSLASAPREALTVLPGRAAVWRPEDACRKALHDWFVEHLHHPYPTEAEKRELALRTGLSLRQVNDYYSNKRMRIRRRARALRAHGLRIDSHAMQSHWPAPTEHIASSAIVSKRASSARGAAWRTHVLPYAKYILLRSYDAVRYGQPQPLSHSQSSCSL
ncbi:hypothetical protein CDCA_CDCA19G4652 [Cyanidium caldarium]|uniref:Homeobox domain-containing protein n=1 Tax=Cyanidium caldarium TaxID=2771 RepID=A0AAV9J243_CYACA|nr:hypothetical protein CDCA_CDCA19G4652 [Cyanidium caldarium]